MKNNILHRFALHDLKNHRHDTICMSIIIFVVTFVVFLTFYLTPVIQNYNFLEYQYQYGTENCIIE